MTEQIKKMMFKIISFFIVFILSLAPAFTTALADEKVSWEENNADIAVYDTDFKDLYEIDYLNTATGIYESTYEKDVKNGIRLLMVNGGFVADPGTILYDDGVVFISANKLAGAIGVNIRTFQDENYGTTISIKNGNSTLTMNYYSADFNGESLNIKYGLERINGDVYVPLRLVVEKFGGKIEYIKDYVDSICNVYYTMDHPEINMIVVEMPSNHEKTYTVDEGLSEIKEMSVEEHDYVVDYMKEIKQPFDENNPDYDPLMIKYTGNNIGRYYVYELEGFEDMPIFFNKYTGEVYSNKPGLPFVNIEKGFPNIGWLYQ